jgi:hypothetical protein
VSICLSFTPMAIHRLYGFPGTRLSGTSSRERALALDRVSNISLSSERKISRDRELYLSTERSSWPALGISLVPHSLVPKHHIWSKNMESIPVVKQA